MIKAVTFDLWHTIIYEPDDAFMQRTRMIRMRNTWRTLKELGHEISYEEVKVGFHHHDFLLEDVWSADKDVSEKTQLRMLLDCLGIKKGRRELYGALKEPYRGALMENLPALSDGITDTLETLKKRGYAIGIISNTGHTSGKGLRDVLKKLEVLQHFDVLTFSDEMRIRKPQSNIFNRTLGTMGVKPKGAAHIGDNIATDVTAARRVGMKGILYDNHSRGRMGKKVDAIIYDFEELPDVLKNLGGM